MLSNLADRGLVRTVGSFFSEEFPLRKKILFFSVGFFLALSGAAWGSSWVVSHSLAKPILKIGGGIGVGVGAVALGVLGCLSKRHTVYFPVYFDACFFQEKDNLTRPIHTNFGQTVWLSCSPCSRGQGWRGYLKVWADPGDNRVLKGMWMRTRETSDEAYILPVHFIVPNERGHWHYLAFTDTCFNPATSPQNKNYLLGENLTAVKVKIKEHFQKGIPRDARTQTRY